MAKVLLITGEVIEVVETVEMLDTAFNDSETLWSIIMPFIHLEAINNENLVDKVNTRININHIVTYY